MLLETNVLGSSRTPWTFWLTATGNKTGTVKRMAFINLLAVLCIELTITGENKI
jgi:hypothetical protein